MFKELQIGGRNRKTDEEIDTEQNLTFAVGPSPDGSRGDFGKINAARVGRKNS
jgi:hypothetical protein